MRTSIVCVAILSLALFGCAKKVDLDAARNAIRQADSDWAGTIAAKDADAFTAAMTSDAVLMAPNTPVVNGSDAIHAWVAQNMAMPGFSVVWTPTGADVGSSGDLGYSIGTYVYQMTMPDGSTITDTGKYATVWKKQADGAWKVAVDIFNSDIPMMTPAMGDSTGAGGQ